MVLDPAANFVRGAADAAIGSADTTISVSDASIFPDPSADGDYNVVVWDADTHPRPDQDSNVEIVRVTGRDTNNDDLTVSRGQESTSAVNHPSGSALQLSPTAKMFGDIETTFGNFWDSSNSHIEQSALENDSVTVAGNSVSLGSSTPVSVDDLSDVASSSESAGQTLLYHGTNTQFENAAITAGTGVSKTTGDASLTLSLDESVLEDGNAKELDVADLAGGLGTSNQLPITDGSAVSWGTAPNAALTNDTITRTAGDGLKYSSGSAGLALGGSGTLAVEPADFAGDGLADDGSDNLTPDTSDTGTVTATGGSQPAVDTTVSTSLSQTAAYDVILYVDSDPAFNADYQYNWDYGHVWDDSTSTLKLDLTVNWDTDPGSSNDLTLRWEAIKR